MAVEHRHDDRHDAHEHDAALDEVVRDRGHVASEHHVNAGDDRHDDDAVLVRDVDAERDDDQAAQAVVDARGVRDEEHEDDGRRRDAQRARVVALAEELGHGRGLQAVRHLAGARAEHPPREQRADDRVADARPGRAEAVAVAELAGVSDEDDGAEVAGAVRERAEPRADVAPAEHEAVDRARRPARVDSNADRDDEEQDDDCDFPNHGYFLCWGGWRATLRQTRSGFFQVAHAVPEAVWRNVTDRV